MKIGIYGGSFNPFHNGHEMISYLALKKLKLDILIIVPVGTPSHRANNLEDGDIRLEIIRTIFKDNKKVIISDIEINNNGKSYTVDTLLKLKNIYGKEHTYYEIIGEDSLQSFNSWKDSETILKESYLAVFKRRGYEQNIKNDKIIFVESPYFDISASMIRKYLKEGRDISNFVNSSVVDIIKKEMMDNV